MAIFEAAEQGPQSSEEWMQQVTDHQRLSQDIKVARLQSEFCTKTIFRVTNFVTKNAPMFSPNLLSLCSVGQKKSRKIPSKFPTKFSKFPCEKSKKIHRRASAGAQGEQDTQPPLTPRRGLDYRGLVAQCSATPATVAATPLCSATPFQTQISVRHLPAHGGGGATPKFLGGVARHRCYTCKML